MQVVLYTDDMEAITVIDLPQWALERLQDGEYFLMRVMEPPRVEAGPIGFDQPKDVVIWAEKLIRKGKKTWLLFTRDEEAALILKSDVLPGQRRAFQDEYRSGFINAILRVLSEC